MRARYLRIVCGFLAVAAGAATADEPGIGSLPAWSVRNIEVTETAPPIPGAEATQLSVADDGDAQISIDVTDGKEQTKGLILVISGRWMVTKGLTLQRGSETNLMDIAALNSQLVMALLNTTLPQGPPGPGESVKVEHTETQRALRVGTSSGSGEYGVPWKVSGTVSVASADAPTVFQLDFVFSSREDKEAAHLSGQVSRPQPAVSIPDSLPLSGWAVYSIGPHQESTPDGPKVKYGAVAAADAATVGELRLRK